MGGAEGMGLFNDFWFNPSINKKEKPYSAYFKMYKRKMENILTHIPDLGP